MVTTAQVRRAERFQRIVRDKHLAADMKGASIRGGAYATTAIALDFVIRTGSIAILARLLVPEHFGLVGMVVAVTIIGERFKDLGLSLATVQQKDITHEQVSTLFWINGGLGLATALVVAALSVPMARFYEDERLMAITLAISTTFVWGGLTIQHEALLRRAMRFGTIAGIGLSASVVSIVVAVVMAFYGFGYWSLVARDLTRSALVAIGIWCACPWVPDAPSPRSGAAKMMQFGGQVASVQVATLLSSNVGSIVIGRFFGASPVGLYRQAQNLVLFPFDQLSYPVWVVSEPALSRLQEDPEKYYRYFRKVLTLFGGITMPLAAFLVVYSGAIVRFVLGPEWMGAVSTFRILAVAAFISPVTNLTGLVMVTCGQSRRYMTLGLLSAVSVVLCALLGALWGPDGVAMGYVGAACVLALPRLYYGLRGTPVSVAGFIAAITRPCLASVLMALALFELQVHLEGRAPVTILITGAVAAVAVYVLAWATIPGGLGEIRELGGDLLGAVRGRKVRPSGQ
jgi:O-antigen/teichoic acid export membrane protein